VLYDVNYQRKKFRKLKIIERAKTTEQCIILKIRALIDSEELQPGDRLPAERDLARQFGVSRSQLRIAIFKLEFYGVVEKYPQSGTRISNIGVLALSGMMSDLVLVQRQDFKTLLEARILAEINAVRFAALRRTTANIYDIQHAQEAFCEKANKGQNAIVEDFMFHHKLAEAGANRLMTSLLIAITPDIIQYYEEYEICNQQENDLLIKEHQVIVNAIVAKDADMAVASLETHFAKLQNYCEYP